jgi:hypothetical protein
LETNVKKTFSLVSVVPTVPFSPDNIYLRWDGLRRNRADGADEGS